MNWRKQIAERPVAVDDSVLKKLVCPRCESAVIFDPARGVMCTNCGASYASGNGIVDLLLDKNKRTQLEKIDYDGTGGITGKAIENIGHAWARVFHNAGIDLKGKDVLEIGGGTGALTLALLQRRQVRHLVATDISAVFLAKMLDRVNGEFPVTAIRCDCNSMPTTSASFDVVVGRSILHHLLDYQQVLRQCARILRPGGVAIFFEPVLEGKLTVAFFGALVANLAKSEANPALSEQEVDRIRSVVRHITKASWHPQDRESLSRLEDKYIFTIAGMQESAKTAGFRSSEIIRDNRELDQTFWSYFVNTMRIVGIPAEKLEGYRFLSLAYQQTFGAFRDLVHEPMNYFCFRK